VQQKDESVTNFYSRCIEDIKKLLKTGHVTTDEELGEEFEAMTAPAKSSGQEALEERRSRYNGNGDLYGKLDGTNQGKIVRKVTREFG